MPDQRRSFSIQRGRGATARQVTGRTRELGVPSGGGLRDLSASASGLNVPTRPLQESDTRTINSEGRPYVTGASVGADYRSE